MKFFSCGILPANSEHLLNCNFIKKMEVLHGRLMAADSEDSRVDASIAYTGGRVPDIAF